MYTTHRLGQTCLLASTLALLPLVASAADSAASPAANVSAPAASPATPEKKKATGGGGIGYEKSFTVTPQGKWTGPRTDDGQPDIEGHWSNTISNHANFTDPQGGIPGDPSFERKQPGPRNERAPSRVSDPADGEIPYQPWARAKQQEFLKYFFNPIKPEYIEPLARCAPAGVPKSLYWHGYEIRQYPGYVVFFFSSGTRVIHLDGKPHLPSNIKLWNADSRGHWEGNTLVVDVTNSNGKARFSRTGDFASENATFQEKYIFANDRSRYTYQSVVTDPTVYTRPFTVTIPARRYTLDDKPNGWHYEVYINKRDAKGGTPTIERDERICVENNGGFGQADHGPKK